MAMSAPSENGELRRYLIELRPPDTGWAQVSQIAERARLAARELRAAGTPVRFLRSVYVPEDDACYLLYEAPSEASLREALTAAGLTATRIASALPLTEGVGGHALEGSHHRRRGG